MVATLYSDILRQASSKRFKYGDVELRDWFREKALSASNPATAEQTINAAKASNNKYEASIGKMFLYRYDPKHKATLKYYDQFPLIFPIEHYDDGWLGINMHYLPPLYRARLMDMLYETISNQRYDGRAKLQINYKILNAVSKYRYFKPTIHRYLRSHVRSSLVQIDIKEWDYALMLPLAQFKKANMRTVWDDSIDMITG